MTRRIQQVNQLIQKELSQIILREIELPPGVLLTLTRVETSVDLDQAKAYISVVPEDYRKTAFQILNQEIYSLQRELNKRLKMKIIPKIEFIEEKETAKAGRIEEVLEELKRKKRQHKDRA
jgi:ribosome-binding factor A